MWCSEGPMRITAALILAGALCACDADGRRVGAAIFLAPTAPAAIAVSINRVLTSPPPFDGSVACAFTPTFDVVVLAIAPVRLEHVTIQMIDGSVLGGPMIPIPQSAPVNGTMFMAAGVRRTFTFPSSISCASPVPRTVKASVVCVNQAGVRQTIVADGPFL